MNATDLVNGLLTGGLYVLVALGLSLVFGVLRLINLAHGVLVVGAAYLALWLGSAAGLGPFVALPFVVIVAALFGYLLQRVLLTHLLLEGLAVGIVGTFGLAIIAEAAFASGFTSNVQSLPSSLGSSGVTIGGVTMRLSLLLAFALAVVLSVTLDLVIRRTRPGAALRAAAAQPATAQLMGINVGAVFAGTLAIAAALAAIAGVLVGVSASFTPTSDQALLLTGIAVVVVGGVGNLIGTLLAGLGLGLVQAIGVGLLGGGYSNLVIYLVFFVTLALRPTGLLGRGTLVGGT
jgi:branched-chain amino acid transport system permease protein